MQTDFSPEHLPSWMRQPHRSFDWGVLLAGALGLIAAWAFLVRPGVPAYSDLLHSGFMAADLAEGLREGQLFARWSPHALGGYGAPIVTFLPQGAAFVVALIDQLFTGDIASALRLALVSSITGAAVSQYLLCRRWVSPTAALMSAALYVFSPILSLTAPHIKGDMAGVAAMAVFPFLLWCVTRLASNSSVWDVPLTALAVTALLYLHPPLAAAGVAVASIIAIPDGRTALLRLAGATVAAVGLFAPFWLPAIAHMHEVAWKAGNQFGPTVISFRQLIELLNPIDPVTLNPTPQYTLGAVLPIFALAALAWAAKTRIHRRFITTLSLAALASAAYAVASGESWPTYLLTLSVTAIGGTALEWRIYLPFLLRRVALPASLILLLMLSQAVWLSPFGPSIHDFSPLAQIEFESNGFGAAVLPAGTPMPVTTRAGLAVERSLVESYASPPLTRIQPGTPARVTPISSGTHSSAWQVSTTTPTRLTITLAYFPNWYATLDGQPLTVEKDASGLLSVSLPQTTNGTLRITFNPLPEDGVAWIAVAVSLIGLVIWVRLGKADELQSVPILNVQEVRLTSFAVAAISIALISVAIPDGGFRLRPESFSSLRNAMSLTATSDPLRLLAYKFDTTRISPGEPLPVTLYWTTLKDTDTNYGVRLILIDIDRQIRYPLTTPDAPGHLPTGRWLAGYMVQDEYRLHVPGNLTVGTYQLSVEAYPCNAGCDLRQPQQFLTSLGTERPSITLPTVLAVGG